MEFEIANEIDEVTRNNYCGIFHQYRSRNQFKQLINKGFYFVDGSAISNAEKERFYTSGFTAIPGYEEVHRTLGSQPMFWGLVDIADYLKVGLRDI